MGIAIGALLGGLQLFLLTIGTKSLAGGKIKIWAFVAQFFCPIAGLLLCAFFFLPQLLACACVMAGILIFGALGQFLYRTAREKREKSGKNKKVK